MRGLFQGQLFKVVNGETFDGVFDDQLNGTGKVLGSIYNSEGEFENGKLNGPGKVSVFSTIEEGIFKNGALVSAVINTPPVATT